jgi:hypothetical protein
MGLRRQQSEALLSDQAAGRSLRTPDERDVRSRTADEAFAVPSAHEGRPKTALARPFSLPCLRGEPSPRKGGGRVGVR